MQHIAKKKKKMCESGRNEGLGWHTCCPQRPPSRLIFTVIMKLSPILHTEGDTTIAEVCSTIFLSKQL